MSTIDQKQHQNRHVRFKEEVEKWLCHKMACKN